MRYLRWLVATALFGVLAFVCLSRFYPPLPNPLILEFVLSPTDHGNQSDPIVTAGVTGQADFLYLHRADPGIIFIGYDSWNSDSAHSPRVPLAIGVRHRLRIEMPSLDQFQGHFTGEQPGPVRVWLNDALLLDVRAHYYVRKASAIYVGENPLGGTSAEPHFGGKLFDSSGREIRGGAEKLFPWTARLRGWLVHAWGQVVALLALAFAVGKYGGHLHPSRLCVLLRATITATSQHRWFAGSTLLCASLFAWFVTMGGFDFGYPESFCTFYDFQARSLLQGRLDVPEESLSGEAFRVDGKSYGYFGVTPALLRLPFAIFDVGLGRLSRAFMLADYVAAVFAAYLVFLVVRRIVTGTVVPPRPAIAVLFVINVGLGSTLFFLGSRSYVYHEAILCGAAFALFAVWCTLQYWAAPESRWWIGGLICGVLAVHARPPIGLFALSLLGVVALVSLIRHRHRTALLVATLCVFGTLSFNALAYLKFRTFDGQPLRYNANYDAARLAKFGERKFHAGNIPFVGSSYLITPSFEITRGFPWFYAEPKPTWRPAWTKMDMIEPTVAFPYVMPGLFGLATLGAIVAWRTRPNSREPLVLLWAAIVPMAVLLFAAIAISHRYTADFVPFLVSTAAIGLATMECRTGRGRLAVTASLCAATLWAVATTAALTLHEQREHLWGVPEEVRTNYQHLRNRVDRFFGARP